MLLITVQCRYICHFLIRQHEIKYVDILSDMGRIAATRNGHHAALIVPAQDDLHL